MIVMREFTTEAEAVLLGNVLLNNGCIPQVLWQLSAEDFGEEKHRLIFRAMVELETQKRVIDPLTLQEQLTKWEQWSVQSTPGKVTSVDLMEVLHGVPRLFNLDEYLRQVRGASLKRKALNLGNWLRNEAADVSIAPEDLLASLQNKVEALGHIGGGDDLVNGERAVERVLSELETRWQEDKMVIGLPTGFTDLDYILSGLRNGKLYVVAAPPGMGKTTLALNLAQNAVGFYQGEGCPVGAIITLEMSVEEVMVKNLATATRLPANRIETGFLSDAEKEQVRHAAAMLRQLPTYYVENFARVTARSIAAHVEKIRAEQGRIDFVIVDYLQLLDADNKHENDVARLTEISRTLKRIALQYSIPVIALSQMSREGVNFTQEPQLKHLRGSGSIEQDADVVLFIWPADAADPEGNMKKLFVKKHRGGPKGIVDLVFFGAQSRFESAARVGDYGALNAPVQQGECPW